MAAARPRATSSLSVVGPSQLPRLTPLQAFDTAHERRTFLRAARVFRSTMSSFGVTEVRVDGDWLVSVGGDGRIVVRRVGAPKD